MRLLLLQLCITSSAELKIINIIINTVIFRVNSIRFPYLLYDVPTVIESNGLIFNTYN